MFCLLKSINLDTILRHSNFSLLLASFLYIEHWSERELYRLSTTSVHYYKWSCLMSPFVRPSVGLTSILLSEHLFCIICIFPSTPLTRNFFLAVSSWDCTWKWYYKDGTKPNNQSGGYPSYVWIILSPHPDQVCVFHVLLSETPLCACLSVGQLVFRTICP